MLTQVRTAALAMLTIVAAPAGRPTTDPLLAQSVAVVGGDIDFVEAPGATARRLTSAGLDTEVTLSPDGHTIAFVRRTPGLMVNTVTGPDEAIELSVMRIDGTGARLLVRGRTGTTTEDTLAGFRSLQFSPDGRRVYFLSPAWVTSSAVHVATVEGGRTRFVCPGNTLEVIPRGEYAGYLMVTQHRYFLAGGSYDWLWLVHPDGQTVGPIMDPEAPDAGQRLAEFRAMYVSAPTTRGAASGRPRRTDRGPSRFSPYLGEPATWFRPAATMVTASSFPSIVFIVSHRRRPRDASFSLRIHGARADAPPERRERSHP